MKNSVHYLKVALQSNEENLFYEKICKDNLLTIWRKQSEFLTLFSVSPNSFYMKQRFPFLKSRQKALFSSVPIFYKLGTEKAF